MDTGTLHSIATVLAALAFTGVCVWAYGSKRKAGFEEAAQLPFADDHLSNESEAEERQ